MWTPAFLQSFSIDQDFNYALTEFSIQDIIFGLLLLISFNLYTSVINQFIFVQIKNDVFKISRLVDLSLFLFLVYGILFVASLLITFIIPIPDLVIILLLILYTILFLSIYIKIDYNDKSYVESIIMGYMLFQHNIKNIFISLIAHFLALITSTYIIVMIGVVMNQVFFGNMSIILINILFYIVSYFLSIIWIYFYLSLDKKMLIKS